MDFYEAVNLRKTIREFSKEPVEEQKLTKILEAGIKAPSHNHLREWEFTFIRDYKMREKIVYEGDKIKDINKSEIQEQYKENEDISKEMYLNAVPLQKKMLLSSPELLIVCYKVKKNIKEIDNMYDLNNFASVWCCIENILLAMTAEGLYGVTYIPKNNEKIKRILSIPENYEIAAIIPIGYPDKNAKRVKQKEININNKIHKILSENYTNQFIK